MVESSQQPAAHDGPDASGGVEALRAEVASLSRRVEALEARPASATPSAGTKPAGTAPAVDPAPEASPGRS